MDAEKYLNIPQIPDSTNFWMIRTKDGYFFNEYIDECFIAIGWNIIRSSSFPLSKSQEDHLKDSIREIYGIIQSGSSINKCSKFCRDMKVGDIAVIVGKSHIAFAKIGELYEETNPEFTVEYEIEINKQIEDGVSVNEIHCPYIKRRKIEIINVIKNTENINPYFSKVLSANRHSLSSANRHADTILSTCYDVYIWNDTLSIAFRVDKNENINAIALSRFISYFSDFLIDIDEREISIKTALNSPGDVILQVCNWAVENWPIFVMAYMALFGTKIGPVEIHSVWSIIKYFLQRHDEAKLKELEARGRELDNALKEEEIRALKLKNDEVEEKLRLTLPRLQHVSNELEIRKPKNNIINLSAALNEIPHSEK